MLLRGLALLHDTLMAAAAFALAIVLRIGTDGFHVEWREFESASALFAAIVTVCGLAFGMNRGVWRYASIPDLIAIVKTATASIAIFVVVHFLLIRLHDIPRSCVFIAWAFSILFLAIPRVAYRIHRNRRDTIRNTQNAKLTPKRVLLIGANDNADLFIKTIRERQAAPYEVLGIIDERGRRIGRLIRGIPVLGGVGEIPRLVAEFESRDRPVEALVLVRSREEYQKHADLDRLIEIAVEQQLEMLRLPNLLEMQQIDAELNVRPVKLEDLLQRAPIRHELHQVAEFVKNRKVLITGAGGSIGSELARQVLMLAPSSVVLSDSSEFLLYSIEAELRTQTPNVPLTALLCNIREREAVRRLIGDEQPDIVFHAAALKHVPIVEMQPLEGVFTNAIGTRNVADACHATNVKTMVLVSTDKAVNPANVMGATKRLAEMYCQAFDVNSGTDGPRFVTVRFGNVLGSAGSVVPLFERQIKGGGPVTVTHPEIERYFMTIPEACLLILQAAMHAVKAQEERGRIFVLDMGTPVKIVDLARNLIRLSGMRPDVDIRIVYTGLRPGEKLYEEMFASRETLVETGEAGILAAFPRPVDRQMIGRIFDELERLVAARDIRAMLRLLRSAVSDFNPGPYVQSLLSGETFPTSVKPDNGERSVERP
jgi:O-antigen biosynthesis protein WbqV